MYLVAIAWAYVVLMMALAEALSPQGTILGALFTLLLYGILPLGIVLYILGTPLRRRARLAAEQADARDAASTADSAAASAAGSAAESAAAVGPAAAACEPDRGGHPSGAPLAAERKEP